MKPFIRPLLPAALLTALLAAAPAYASDGVVLIDQARALAGGVTPGDQPGFPVTISLPGAYRLASDLTVEDVALPAVQLGGAVSGVSIDLGGFSINGPRCAGGRCHIGAPYTSGIVGGRHVRIRNGHVTGFTKNGIEILDKATLEGVRSTRNHYCGAILGNDSLVRDSAFTDNGFCGFSGSGVLRNSLLARNGQMQAHGSGTGLASGNNLQGRWPMTEMHSSGDNLCIDAGAASKC